MPPGDPQKESAARGGPAAVGIAAFAVVCCAAFPLLAALAGGVALGTILGVGAGLVAAAVLVGLIVVRARRRRACQTLGEAPAAHDGARPRETAR